ncbi:hypothetical protein AB0F91_01690 [Amycolatopsis sp. NPDC023774]|uniref:hypothetical protein n=1 Tax=Amycolatopsis sp. NPDC023774 TaxID=3155015 RepID=UPI00340BF1E6
MRSIEVGNIEIHALADGRRRRPAPFFPGLDAGRHPDAFAEDGTVHVPTGAFLLRGNGRTILVDAGLGPREIEFRKACGPTTATWARVAACPSLSPRPGAHRPTSTRFC